VKQTIYLDYAAATPVSKTVYDAMQPYFTDKFYNPSATYLAAKSVRADVDSERAKVAQTLGARPAEIIFTAGGTEANNLAIKGVAMSFPGSHVVSTALEHDSVRLPMQFLAEQGWNYTEVTPNPDGIVDPNAVIKAVTDKTVLVSVMYANNEIGTVQPIREISQALQKIKDQRRQAGNDLPLYLHTDACQAANYLDLHVSRLGVDLMTLNGGKIYGPKQSGMLYAASHVELQPLIHGGGQELNRRSGTENIAGIVGFAMALQEAQAKRHAEIKRLQDLQTQFISQLQERIPKLVINGSLKHRLPNNVHVTIPGQDNERLIFGLDEAGIQAAAGSACSASKEEPSHVLFGIGLTEKEAQASLRFTMGRETDKTALMNCVDTLAKLVASYN
jgi:cysteine desulfurase